MKVQKLFKEIPINSFFWHNGILFFKVKPLRYVESSPNATFLEEGPKRGFAIFEDEELVLQTVKETASK